MLRPFRRPLQNITGFAGGNLEDQLRRRVLDQPDISYDDPTVAPQNPLLRLVKPEEDKFPTDVSPEWPTPTIDTLSGDTASPTMLPMPTRPETQINPLQRARQNLSDAQNEPLTFGTDREGNVRYSPKGGIKSRFIAGAKTSGRVIPAGLTYGPGGGIGAGIAGMIRGTIDPTTPAKLRRLDHIQHAEQSYGQESDMAQDELRQEATQEQINTLRRRPDQDKEAREERERDNISANYRAILSSGQEFDPTSNPDHKAMYDRAKALRMTLPAGEKRQTVRQPIFRDRANADGSTTTLKSVDNGETWAEEPKLGSAAQPKGEETSASRADRARKLRAAQSKLSSLENQEAEAAKQKDAAFAEVGRLQALMESQGESESLKQQLTTARQTVEKAQAYYAGFGEKKSVAQSDVDENADLPGASQKLTIEGAIEHFQKRKKRKPTEQEIANMRKAIGQ